MVQLHASLCFPNREVEYVTLDDVNLSENAKYLKVEIANKITSFGLDEIGMLNAMIPLFSYISLFNFHN